MYACMLHCRMLHGVHCMSMVSWPIVSLHCSPVAGYDVRCWLHGCGMLHAHIAASSCSASHVPRRMFRVACCPLLTAETYSASADQSDTRADIDVRADCAAGPQGRCRPRVRPTPTRCAKSATCGMRLMKPDTDLVGMLHAPGCMLHAACACCMPHAACCMLDCACCILHAACACCMLHYRSAGAADLVTYPVEAEQPSLSVALRRRNGCDQRERRLFHVAVVCVLHAVDRVLHAVVRVLHAVVSVLRAVVRVLPAVPAALSSLQRSVDEHIGRILGRTATQMVQNPANPPPPALLCSALLCGSAAVAVALARGPVVRSVVVTR